MHLDYWIISLNPSTQSQELSPRRGIDWMVGEHFALAGEGQEDEVLAAREDRPAGVHAL